jgi:hypothetical protein
MRAMKNRVRKIAPKKLHSASLRFRQIRPGQNRFRHVRVSQVSLAKVRAGQIRSRQLGLAQVRTLEIRASQNRSAQIDALQISARQIGASQVRSRTSFLPAKEPLVRLKNLRQLLAVVLNAFRFSQSHDVLSTPSSDIHFTHSPSP